MVEARIDELQRQYLATQDFAEVLMALDIAADAIARVERRTAEQRVPRSLEEPPFRQMFHGEAVFREPGVEPRRLAAPALRDGNVS